MKIIIASGIYPPDIGGPATYSQLIAREFTKRGIDIAVICYSDNVGHNVGHTTSYIEPFLVVRILRRYNRLIRYWLYFWNLLKLSRDSDVIYAQGPLAAGLPAMLLSKILKKKFVIKIVGDYAWEQYCQRSITSLENPNFKFQIPKIEDFQNKRCNLKTEILRTIQKRVVKSADKAIVPSEFLKKLVKGWGVNENKIKVIYNSFDKFDIRSSKLEPLTSNLEQKDIIISAGRLEPWKGFNTLREIMPDLIKENPKFKLIIATKMPHDELMGYFKASKIFVLNSAYEGFSHIILEAMAMGLPVITTNVCGNPEIVKDGYNGLLVEYNNKSQLKEAILRLWRDKNLQKKFIDNGKKTLEKFKLETMIEKTLNILKS